MKISLRNLSKLKPEHLKLTKTSLVPELKLHLLTSEDSQWYSKSSDNGQNDPFWAIFWPGGQVLSRYILDTKIAQNLRVLDLGCGCGAQGMKACKAYNRPN